MFTAKNIQKGLVVSIIVSLIVLFSVLNWEYKIEVDTKPLASIEQPAHLKNIPIYYYPSRLHVAEALTFYFSEQGFVVKMLPAESSPEITTSSHVESYIFFNQEQFGEAMKVKSSIEKVLQSPVNAYRFKEYQVKPAIMMVFTNA